MAQSQRHRQLRWNIISYHLPQAVVRFLEKNEDYGEGNDEFGAKGEVLEIARKYKKLKAVFWEGKTLSGEPVEEVIDDMIGHLLLLREQIWDGPPLAIPNKEFDYVGWAAAYGKLMNKFGEALG